MRGRTFLSLSLCVLRATVIDFWRRARAFGPRCSGRREASEDYQQVAAAAAAAAAGFNSDAEWLLNGRRTSDSCSPRLATDTHTHVRAGY